MFREIHDHIILIIRRTASKRGKFVMIKYTKTNRSLLMGGIILCAAMLTILSLNYGVPPAISLILPPPEIERCLQCLPLSVWVVILVIEIYHFGTAEEKNVKKKAAILPIGDEHGINDVPAMKEPYKVSSTDDDAPCTSLHICRRQKKRRLGVRRTKFGRTLETVLIRKKEEVPVTIVRSITA